jgi:hypothetical protein
MTRKFLIGLVAVFVLSEIVNIVVNGFMLQATYESLKTLWRPDMDRLMWVYHVMNAIGAFFFVLVFSKGYEGTGVGEGVRYGLYIGVWLGVGMAYGTYAMIAIPYSLAFTWFVSTIIQYVLCGVAVALIFGKQAIVTRVRS